MTAGAQKVGILIPCRNEKQNIGPLLSHLVSLQLQHWDVEHIVVVSDSNDGTDDIVSQWAHTTARKILLTKTAGGARGKSSAISQGLACLQDVDIVILISADVRPREDCLATLLQAFDSDEVGVAGGRPIPVGPSHSLAHAVNCFLWDTHHFFALDYPKTTEVTAFRRAFLSQLEAGCSVDELDIEHQFMKLGYNIAYLPNAEIETQSVLTLREYVRQRSRVTTGYLRFSSRRGYSTPSLSLMRRLTYSWRTLREKPSNVLIYPLVLALEGYIMMHALFYARHPQDSGIWSRIASTKRPFS